MRSLLFVSVLALSALAPAQTRQLQADGHRYPAVHLAGTFEAYACGDVDGDGDLDCVAAHATPLFGSATVVLFRRVAGSWQQVTLATYQGAPGLPPRLEIALADLDGDVDLDVLVILAGSTGSDARFELFQNTGGMPQFAGAATLAGSALAAVATGDVDGDADRDLIVTRADGAGQAQAPTLFLHDGAFGFQAQPAALPATPLLAPELADIDGDGDPDLVAVDAGGSVLVLTNQAGTFSAGVVVGGPAQQVVAADLDGDGDGDLVQQRSDGAVDLLWNTALGFQGVPIGTGAVRAGARLRLADVDGNQFLDVVHVVDGELRILRNHGPTFTTEVIAGVRSFDVGDVDEDGRADVLFDFDDSGLAVAFGRLDRMLFDPMLQRRPFVPNRGGGTEDAADLDLDGRIDLLQEAFYQVHARRNRGAGAWSTVVLPVPFLRSSVRAADVDGDGDRDVVVMSENDPGGLQVFRLDPGFVFTALPPQSLARGYLAAAADLDGDGLDDLVAVTYSGPAVRVLRNLGSGVFAPPAMVWPEIVGTPQLWDWDGDQDPDLLFAPGSAAGYCVALMENDGNGSFSLGNACEIPAPFLWGHLDKMKLVDVDDDGDADVFAWTHGSGRVLLNQGGMFVQSQVIHTAQGTSSLMKPWFADWDDDGDTDLLQLGGRAQLWMNTGNGSFVDETAARLGSVELFGAGAADIDGDGDPDVLGAFGMLASDPMNHLRSATTLARPTPGGQLQVRFAHEPGFAASPTLCIPIVAFGPRASPLAVAGIRGTWQLDITTTATLPLVNLPAPSGTAESTLAIPTLPGLVGLDLYVQGLTLGATPGFTPALHERILP